jgi:hypothetical protein
MQQAELKFGLRRASLVQKNFLIRAFFYTKGVTNFIAYLFNIEIKNARTYSGSCTNQGLPSRAIFSRF